MNLAPAMALTLLALPPLVSGCGRSDFGLPPLIVSDVEPRVVLSGASSSIELGGRFYALVRGAPTRIPERLDVSYAVVVEGEVLGARWIDAENLEFVLPAHVSAGLYDVMVVAPDGQRASLERALRVVSPACEPLPLARTSIARPRDGAELMQAVAAAGPDTAILLAEGADYDLETTLTFSTPHVTLRTESAAQPATLRLTHGAGSMIAIVASDVVVAHVRLEDAPSQALAITGGVSDDVESALIYGVTVIDPESHMVGIGPGHGHYADRGVVACSEFVLSPAAPAAAAVVSLYGVSGIGAEGWRVVHNRFRGIRTQHSESVAAVRFREASRHTLVAGNRMSGCHVGVQLGDVLERPTAARDYGDPEGATYFDHLGGVVRNNFVSATAPVDGGIVVWNAARTRVLHNTVAFENASDLFWLELRWLREGNDLTIANNLANVDRRERDNEASVVRDEGDVRMENSWVVDLSAGNLHLSTSAEVDNGVSLPDGWANQDIDGDLRDDGNPDAGADER